MLETILVGPRLEIPQQDLVEFCERWKVAELALFGSALRDDFRPDSDIDLLVTFLPEAEWSLLDHGRMEQELASLLGRDVDLVSRWGIEHSRNWIRRKAILESAYPIYGSR